MTIRRSYIGYGEIAVKGKRIWFPLLITLLMGVLYTLNVTDAVRFLAGGLFLVMLLCVGEETSFYMLMFAICANEILNFGSTSIVMIFVMLYTVKSFLSSGLRFRIYWPLTLSLAALLVISAYAHIVGIDEQLLTTIKLVFFLHYMAAVLTKSGDNRQRLYTNAFRFVALGINFFCIVSVLFNGIPSLTERFAFHEDVTLNMTAITCAVTITNLLYIIIVLKSAHTATDIMLIIGCCVWGILTQSRSFILATAIGIVLLFLLTSSIKQKGKILLWFGIAAILFVVLIILVPGVADRIQMAVDRIINPKDDDISNGRYGLWEQSINAMQHGGYAWLGAGNFAKLGAVYQDTIYMAHNFIIETWVIYGYIGCALLIAVFFFFIRHYVFNVPKVKFRMVSAVPLVVMLCALFYSHHFIGRSFSMVFILNWLPLTFEKTKSI